MKKLLALILTSTMLLTGIVGCSSRTSEDIVLATSGEDTILLRDYLYMFNSSRMQQEMFLEMFGFSEEDIHSFWHETDELLENTDNGEATEDAEVTEGAEALTQEQILKEMTLENVKYQASLLKLAQQQGYTYDEEELRLIEQEIDNFIMQLNSPEARGEDVFFSIYNITPQDFKEMQKNELTRYAYVMALADTITVPEEEIIEYYNENTENVQRSLGINATARHILIATNEEMTEEEREEATQRANDILRRVESGEDIGELAATYSDDEGSANNNGEYTFPRGQMVPEFENWAFSAQPGDIGMVESQFGYHIMYSVGVDSIEDYYEDIKLMMIQGDLSIMIDNLIEEANIVWVVNEEVLNSVTIL